MTNIEKKKEGDVFVVRDLEAGVEVPVQPLHDEQHGDAGAVGVGVVDDRAVQVDQPLVFGQCPAAGWRQRQRTGDATLTQPHSSGLMQQQRFHLLADGQ